MKTNGTREINLEIEDCKNCGIYEQGFSHFNKGKISQFVVSRVQHPFDEGIYIKFIDCQVCNGTGYIPVCCDNKLELE